MNWNHPHALAKRATVTNWLVAAVLGVIGIAFFRLQVIGSDRFYLQSEQNRLRPITLPAPRGVITDRHGVVLAENVPSYTISLIGARAEMLDAMLAEIAPLARLTSDDLAAIKQRPRRRSDDAVVILRDAPFQVVSALEERRRAFPGLHIQTEPKRRYPLRGAVSHVVGYVGEISEQELRNQSVRGARSGAQVGRAGIENQYDDILRGEDGRRFVEVDALGRTVRDDEGVPEGLMAQPGDTLKMTIDLALQQYAMESFPPGALGAVVAMDPRNGDVLAMYSSPSFDPNELVGGVDPAVWDAWLAGDKPLFNRAVQGLYPPGSPWKLAVAAMALRRGIVTPDTKMATPCHGGLQYFNRYFRCWHAEGHGDLTLAEAIQHSCNVYFYQLGQQLGLDQVLTDGSDFGFGQRTGIDLPNETRSIFPSSTAYFDELHGPRGWTRAVTLNLSIGQGENAQTLMNMVRFYAMVANADGRARRPRLVASDVPMPDGPSLGLSRDDLLALRHALVNVVETGTARRSRIADLEIAGKTGTAQNSQGPDHGWFVAFAPATEPEVVVGAIVQFGEHGSAVAPFVNRVIAYHLLGPDAVEEALPVWQFPADSAPVDLPIPDSSATRTIGGGR